MMTRLLSMALVLVASTVASARWCSSPWCSMCAEAFGPLPGYMLINGAVARRPRVATNRIPLPASSAQFTPAVVVEAMLREAKLTRDDLLYDIGCGDGRILIEAEKQYGCQALGFEIDGQTAALALRNTRSSSTKRVRIVRGDATKYTLDKATVVVFYQTPELMRKVMPKLRPSARIVSYSHAIPGHHNRRVLVRGKYPVYVVDRRPVDYFDMAPLEETEMMSGLILAAALTGGCDYNHGPVCVRHPVARAAVLAPARAARVAVRAPVVVVSHRVVAPCSNGQCGYRRGVFRWR